MTKIELIKALQECEAPDDAEMWIQYGANNSSQSSRTFFDSDDCECEGISIIKDGVLLTTY